MKYIRWIIAIILIIIIGYLSGIVLFTDSTSGEMAGLIVIFLGGSAAVGALLPNQWLLSGLCSWGVLTLVMLELGSGIGRDPVSGQQPTLQVILIGVGALGLALLNGYIGTSLYRWITGKNKE